MDRFAAAQAFVAVADARSFSEAARRLRVAKSVVSRQVAALEAALGVTLLNRTTRSLSLTEAGRGYYERIERVLADFEDADRAVSDTRAAPCGKLKVSAPLSFGFLHLAPALSDFLLRHPGVSMDVAMNDRFVDLVSEGFDLAVRVGTLADSSLIARRLAPARRVVCASPAYLAARGAPQTPDDLQRHECLFNGNLATGREWRFVGAKGAPWPVAVEGRLNLDNGDALRVAALHGLGLAILPTFIVGADLQSGALATVLADYLPQDLSINAVYPQVRHLSPTVRAFVDFLAARFGPDPYWDLVG
ncbi:MAG: LysR family transcriptional regulator [Pseudomonadota bacterium]|nr:LysR family transcriptional regulator [Pseudomonadota bacterium]